MPSSDIWGVEIGQTWVYTDPSWGGGPKGASTTCWNFWTLVNNDDTNLIFNIILKIKNEVISFCDVIILVITEILRLFI